MKDLSSKWEKVPPEYETLAGRAFTSTVVANEVDPMCHPLREFNKIVIAPGLLAGTNAPSSGRMSVGGKSPLTGGIKESNAGGITGTKLGRLGIKGVIIEGMAPSGTKDWYSILIRKGKCEVIKTNGYANKGLYDVIAQVWKDYTMKPGIIGCGIAGQRLLRAAGIFGNNIENSDPGRYAGRGGLGAVLGSKRVVAIITDDTGGKPPEGKDKTMFDAGRQKLAKALKEHPVTGNGLKAYGTNILQNILNEAGALPTRVFHEARFENAAKISGEAVHELVDKTKQKFGDKAEGKYAHPCHVGCIIACSNAVPYEDTGKMHVAPLEYESAWALGSNLGIGTLQDVAELNRLCNDLGLDTIETGNALGMVMEGGLVKVGDAKGAIAALKSVYDEKNALGWIVGSGAKIAGQTLGVTRIPTVKGQSMPAYDPRAIKGIGVTYATTPMGADHTAGYTIAAEILGIKKQVSDPRNLEKADLSRNFQATTAYIDSSGYCLFIAFAILDIDEGFAGMQESVNGFLGKPVDVGQYGLEVLRKERDFNARAGFTALDDRLPEFLLKEPVPPHNVVFDVPSEELDKVYKVFRT